MRSQEPWIVTSAPPRQCAGRVLVSRNVSDTGALWAGIGRSTGFSFEQLSAEPVGFVWTSRLNRGHRKFSPFAGSPGWLSTLGLQNGQPRFRPG